MNRIFKCLQRGFVAAALISLMGCVGLQTLREENARLKELVKEQQQENEEAKNRFYTLLQQKQRQETETQKEIDRLQREIERYKTQRSQREKDLQARIRELNLNLQNEMDNIAAQKKDLNQKIDELQAQLQAQEAEVQKAKSDLAAAQKSEQAAKQAMAQAQKDLESMRVQVETLTDKESEWQNKINNTAEEIQTREETISSLNKKIAALQETVNDQKEDLQQREKTISELNEKVKQMAQDMNQKQTTEANLRQKIKELQNEMQSKESLTPEAEADYKNKIDNLNQQLEKLKNDRKQAAAAGSQQLKKIQTFLSEALQSAVKDDQAEIFIDNRGVVVRIKSDDMFRPGTVMINPQIRNSLENLARALREFPNHPISVEGHTDDQPIIEMPFPDNLALSVKRAENVTRELIRMGELPQEEIKTVGYGERKPIASNSTVEGRRKNRRVEIVVGPELPEE